MIRAEIIFRYAEKDILKIGRIISTLNSNYKDYG